MSAHPRLRDSGNLLLDQLPAADFDPLEPSLQRVSLTLRQVVHEFDADVAHIYFPTTALMSLMTVLEEDDPVEAATVGREGFIGLARRWASRRARIGRCARWPARASACRSAPSWRRWRGRG